MNDEMKVVLVLFFALGFIVGYLAAGILGVLYVMDTICNPFSEHFDLETESYGIGCKVSPDGLAWYTLEDYITSLSMKEGIK